MSAHNKIIKMVAMNKHDMQNRTGCGRNTSVCNTTRKKELLIIYWIKKTEILKQDIYGKPPPQTLTYVYIKWCLVQYAKSVGKKIIKLQCIKMHSENKWFFSDQVISCVRNSIYWIDNINDQTLHWTFRNGAVKNIYVLQ